MVWTKCHLVDKMAVHHVNVKEVDLCQLKLVNLVFQLSQVCCKNRGCYLVVHAVHTTRPN